MQIIAFCAIISLVIDMDKYFKLNNNFILFHYTSDEHPNANHFKLHTHEWYEVYYFIDGEGSFKIEGNSYTLEKNSVFIMRPNESHYVDINLNKPYTRLSVHFDPAIFENLYCNDALLKPFTDRDRGQLNQYLPKDFISKNYIQIFNNMILPVEDRVIQVTSYILPLLNEIYLSFKERNVPMPKSETAVQRIISYINQNCCQKLTLETISKEFFISKSQLCRVFKKATGSTVWHYITVKRLFIAKEMLLNGISPTKVSADCGFNDYTTFYRAYAKQFGIPPKKV